MDSEGIPQNKEASAFLERITALPSGPGVSLDAVLKPSIDDEAELRMLFASDRGNARLTDPHVGLVDVFAAPAAIRATRARAVDDASSGDSEEFTAKYVMPIKGAVRRAEGAPAMIADIDEFKKNWAVFTEGGLSQLLDWKNVVAAGGSVLACLTPLADKDKASKRAIRKHYHNAAYPTSDIDLFLWGLDAEEAEKKIVQIYEAVRDSIPWDVTCIRTKHTVSIHSQYPYRAIQIVLRLYHSPAEILAGFDVDAPCFAYNGSRVWANPRAIVASMRQCNTVDISRRSPSYEVRLAKYAGRGFEVYVPDLDRQKVDPTIYERSIAKIEGLARLLVFEKLKDGNARYSFLESRRQLRGRPNPLAPCRCDKRRYKGDLKEESGFAGLQMNDYDVATLHIPYGPGWDARKIDKLVYQTDLGMNSRFNPKNKGRRLHRHPAFFGTMQECLEDCCENCPEPIDDDERELQAKEAVTYLSGRIKFIEEDPGRQSMTGSFNPIDIGEWSEQVYVKESDQFFAAIAENNLAYVQERLESGAVDLTARDHVGRTPIHIAIMSNAPEVAHALIEAGVRISARLADGRNALHLAARYGMVGVINALLERNTKNREAIGKEKDEDDDKMDEDGKGDTSERPSSEDDWDSDENDGKAKDEDVDMEDGNNEDEEDEEDDDDKCNSDDGSDSGKAENSPPESDVGDLPDDNGDEPDVFDVDLVDWDFGFTALCYATLFGSPETVDVLIEAGANVTMESGTNHHGATQMHPLTLTILREDEDVACVVAKRLIAKGATSSFADDALMTVFHKMVHSRKVKLVQAVLQSDPNAASVINFPSIRNNNVYFPVVTAIENRDYPMLAVLIAYGVNLKLREEDITRARDAVEPRERSALFGYGVTNYMNHCYTPLETALAKHDDVAQILLAFRTEHNLPLRRSVQMYAHEGARATLKDWVDWAIKFAGCEIRKHGLVNKEGRPVPEISGAWERHLEEHRTVVSEEQKSERAKAAEAHVTAKQLQIWIGTKAYLDDMQRLLDARSPKTWEELHPGCERKAWDLPSASVEYDNAVTTPEFEYAFCSSNWQAPKVPAHLNGAYDQLFEACFTGDNAKVEELCIPARAGRDPAKTYLNISIQVKRTNDNSYEKWGLTPLYAAIQGRHWSTARLIIAIAASQYVPDAKSEERVKFSISNVVLEDDDSDGEDSDCDSDCSDETINQEKQAAKFIDIAKISSDVRSNVHPRYMISEAVFNWKLKDVSRPCNHLIWAIKQKDLEAFKNVLALHSSLSDAPELEPKESRYHSYVRPLDTIIEVDSPEILHEYIRQTGYGLDFEEAKKSISHLPTISNDANRAYLGLNVHGKKRTDLATKNDPDASAVPSTTFRLVWRAAQAKAIRIIEYLAGPKPLEAFRHHATSGTTPRAEQLRRTPDLEKALPAWLGWVINPLGESPLTAAIPAFSLELLKILFEKKPKLMQAALHEKIKFTGHNTFLLALLCVGGVNAKVKVLDFLLENSVSPVEKDTIKGWNAYHFACHSSGTGVIEYLLEKLPRDVTEELLLQQSKGRLNTPLQVATHRGAYKIVELLVERFPDAALIRNVDGQLPLHIACQNGFTNCAKALVRKAPQFGGLFVENSIGQTPYDAVWLKHFLQRVQSSDSGHPADGPSTLDVHHARAEPERIDIEHVETILPRLRETVDMLDADATIASKPDAFKFNMENWMRTLESQLAAAKERRKLIPPAPAPEEDLSDGTVTHSELSGSLTKLLGPEDQTNLEATLRYIEESAQWNFTAATAPSSESKRQLAKLLDVQISVKHNLEKVVDNWDYEKGAARGDLDDEEDSEEKKAWKKSWVHWTVDTDPDTL